MKTRALIAAFALSAIVLGSGVSAFAYNGYHNYGNHAGMYAISPEKQGAYDAMMKDYYSRVSPIQDKLNAKGIELDALSRNQRQAQTISNSPMGWRNSAPAPRRTHDPQRQDGKGTRIQPCRGMMEQRYDEATRGLQQRPIMAAVKSGHGGHAAVTVPCNY
ncbi:MAG: hypothetical protein ACLSHC_11555 [Bilophila wadsworthia]